MSRLPFFILLQFVCYSVVADAKPRYPTDIRPILAKNCFACHGADENSREGDLRLDQPAKSSDKESATARAIVVGQPDRSELIMRITSSDPDVVMPPPDSGHRLADTEIETLRKWIATGAEYETHWAFVLPVRSAVPEIDGADWCHNAIDRFILQRLRQKNLTPADAADPYTLIRRVSLDLTGLPPTPTQADKFAEEPSPVAFERIVDELLRSPRFGEHWATMWLDLARYADTKGYEKDQPRNIWRYRDWVIDAFNSDMPFDQFTREQIAGDLLPNATSDQILATAFHRNTMTNDEGGTDNEEFRIAAVKDRVDTTIQVWMGLTMGCAKCHSHKYDPISQTEYYQFMAFFNQTEDADRPDDTPRVPTPTTEQQRQSDELNQKLAALKKRYAETSPEFADAQRTWESEIAGSVIWNRLRPAHAISENGSTLIIQNDDSVLASGKMPATDVYSITVTSEEALSISAIRIEALTDESLPQSGPGRNSGDPNFVLSEITAELTGTAAAEKTPLKLNVAKADYSQGNWEVTKAIDGNDQTGWAVSPKFGQTHTAIFGLEQPTNVNARQSVTFRFSQQYKPNSLLLGRIRISVSSQPFDLLEPTGKSIAELASLEAEKRSDEDKQRLSDAFRRIYPPTAVIAKKINAEEKRLNDLNAAIVSTPVMRDLSPNKQRETFLHVRGNFLEQGEKVEAGFPATFTALKSERPSNRLDVAEWLMSPRNPLTARVAVNRVWARIFGRGFVETEEDFGTQGMLPSHPELLDWLAVEFREQHHWSLKQLCKAIVQSATYQQDAAITDAVASKDPENRWLSRVPRFRLSAETLRDQALFCAGLLSDRIGGPSVMPPQPGGIWRTTYSKLKWETSQGEDRHRRGLYTFLRRTSPYPSMLTFDGTSREVCQIRRIRTNTPLQALVMLNDPVYLEAAGALAAATAAADDPLTAMFRRILFRPPTSEETRRIEDLFADTLKEYQKDTDAATSVLHECNLKNVAPNQTPRTAASCIVASVLLNLDEIMMRP